MNGDSITRVIEGGYYELGGTPLAEANADDLESYPWPDHNDPASYVGLKEEVEDIYHNTEYAIGAYRPMISGIFELSHYLRGMEKLMMDLILEKKFIDTLLWKLAEVQGEILKKYLDVVGPYIQLIEWADDVGTQNGPMFSPDHLSRINPGKTRLHHKNREGKSAPGQSYAAQLRVCKKIHTLFH